MKKLFALIKVSVKSMLLTSSGAGRGKKKRAVSGVGAVLVIAFLALYLSGVYSSMLVDVLAPIGMEVLVFIFMGIGAVAGGLLFTTFAVKGVVFGGRDNDLLLALPVSTTMLMVSRVVAIYFENLVFSFFMMVPAGVVCAIHAGGGAGYGAAFWARLVLAALGLPLLDTALSVLLGALAAFLSSKLSRGKVLGQNLVIAAYIVLMFWFGLRLNSMLRALTADAAGVKSGMAWAAPIVWMGDGIMGDWGRLGLFLACCVVPFALMVLILGKVYRKAVTAFRAQSARGDYRLGQQRFAGQTRALLRKEARRFFGTPMYFWNAGLGLLMLLALGAAAVVKAPALRELVGRMGPGVPVVPLCAALVGFCLSTCIIAAPSVSLEGKYLWILREAPVGEGRIVRIKTGFQLLLSLPCTVIAVALLSLALGLAAWEWGVLLSAAVLFAVGQAAFSMLMGLTFPKLDAANETVVVKQSMASMLAMLVPMTALAAAGLAWYAGSRLGPAVGYAAALGLLLVLSGVCVGILARRGGAMLRRL